MEITESVTLYEKACQLASKQNQNIFERSLGNKHSSKSNKKKAGLANNINLEIYYSQIINSIISELKTKKESKLISKLCAYNNISVELENFSIKYSNSEFKYTYDLCPLLKGINIALTKGLDESIKLYKSEFEKILFKKKKFDENRGYIRVIVNALLELDVNLGNLLKTKSPQNSISKNYINRDYDSFEDDFRFPMQENDSELNISTKEEPINSKIEVPIIADDTASDNTTENKSTFKEDTVITQGETTGIITSELKTVIKEESINSQIEVPIIADDTVSVNTTENKLTVKEDTVFTQGETTGIITSELKTVIKEEPINSKREVPIIADDTASVNTTDAIIKKEVVIPKEEALGVNTDVSTTKLEVVTRSNEVSVCETVAITKDDEGEEVKDISETNKNNTKLSFTDNLNKLAEERIAEDYEISKKINQLQVVVQSGLKQITEIRDGLDYNIMKESVCQFLAIYDLLYDILEYHKKENCKSKDDYYNLIESCEDLLENIKQSIVLLGVVVIEDIGLEYDPNIHKVERGIRPTRNSTISKIKKNGFIYKNKVFEKAIVEIA